MTTQKVPGFTLIELIVVIIILGILAVFAVPKYIHLDSQARTSTVKALGGTVSAAAEMVHAIAVASNNTNASTINIANGITVTTLPGGYPTPNATGIATAINDLSGFTSATSGNTMTFTKTGATNATNCTVTYTATANSQINVTISSDGC